MKFLPTENISFKTRLKEEEILKRLSDAIEPEKTFRAVRFGMLSGSTKPYEGQISGHTFTIRRIISYRNSFLPRINGIITNDFGRLTINVKMRLPIFVIIFLCVWCGAVGLACIAVLTQGVRVSESHPATLIPFSMLLFVYALTMGGFKYESRKSKKDLTALFQADIVE